MTDETERIAPVIPLFGGRGGHSSDLPAEAGIAPASALPTPPHRSERGEPTVLPWRAESTADAGEQPADARRGRGESLREEPAEDQSVERAALSLLRKLRARSLSISEARQHLRGQEIAAERIDDIIDDCCRRGYLDDAVLAEQLVISGIERKGQGRVALSRALAQRGIARETIDAALGDLPDDDAERALEFARSKARSMSRLDGDTALRRLMGQLARRGYGGSVAMNAARTALREASFGGPTAGVRFVESE